MLVRRLINLAAALMLLVCLQVQAGVSVVIVSHEFSGAYAEAAAALTQELESGGLSRQDWQQLRLDEVRVSQEAAPKLYIALGAEATQALAAQELRAPMLSTLLPRSSFEQILRLSGRKTTAQFSALFLDQPINRQLDLIQLAWPAARRIGVLWGSQSQGVAPTMRAQASARGLTLVEGGLVANEPFFAMLKRVLDDADVLLAVADPQVYNSNSIQNILLASFRAKVPMVAFSPAYVRAGAVLSLHVTPAQIGQQAGLLARGVLLGKSLSSEPQYSRNFSVAVNEHVARSLGLALDADQLAAQLRRREGGP